jgi:hypothetical protein
MRCRDGNKLNKGPDFLGVGAPRSGTTWLHVMLSQHPDIWMPPLKEVHYFDSIDPTIDEKGHVDSLSYRIKWMFFKRMKHYIGYSLKAFNKEFNKAKPDIRWDYAFFKPGGSLSWYQDLFDRPEEFKGIKGEITPAYIMLSPEIINTIRDQLNVKKIIIMLRNPLYSTWSSIEKQVRDGLIKNGDNMDDLVNRIKSPRLFGRYNHADNLNRWFSQYNRDDIFIGFFEELEQNPVSLLSRVFSYLEVEDISSQLSQKASTRVNQSSGSLDAIPERIKYELALLHHEQIGRLRQSIGSYSESWHQEIQEVLKNA